MKVRAYSLETSTKGLEIKRKHDPQHFTGVVAQSQQYKHIIALPPHKGLDPSQAATSTPGIVTETFHTGIPTPHVNSYVTNDCNNTTQLHQ